jgi:hypothetical protein
MTRLDEIAIILSAPRNLSELLLRGWQSDRGVRRNLLTQRGNRFLEDRAHQSFHSPSTPLSVKVLGMYQALPSSAYIVHSENSSPARATASAFSHFSIQRCRLRRD